MKLLVLAQTPPPLHGQSLMVQTLVAGLPAHGIEVHHVNLRLSRDTADIGRWHPGKLLAVLDACASAVLARFRDGCDTLYYVPAPAKRGALYRDWVVLLLCRPFFRRLVLHWHASGLGDWLATRATAPERWVSQLLLGRARLAIVLGEALRADAMKLHPRRLTVVRNGLPDPCPDFAPVRALKPDRIRQALYLGLIVPDKGVREAVAGTLAAGWRLAIAGDIPDADFRRELEAQTGDGRVVLAGFVTGPAKERLFASAEALVFPTYYAAETQGLVVLEALAHDLPVVVANWRAVAENLPLTHAERVAPRSAGAVTDALRRIAALPAPNGRLRAWFLEHGTSAPHLAALAVALRQSGDS